MTAKPDLDQPGLLCHHCGAYTPDPVNVVRCSSCGVTGAMRPAVQA